MPTAELDITIDQRSGIPLYEQVCQQFRSKIESHELTPGMHLPTNHELGSRLQVSYKTAHLAMATLAKEGYVTRQARRGTVVKGIPTRGVVGIFSWMELLGRHDGYYRLIARQLGEQLANQERHYRMYMGSESPRSPNLACNDLIRHVSAGTICGVVLTLSFPQMEELMAAARESRTPVVALVGLQTADYSVSADYQGMVRSAANYLMERGRRRVGVIYNRASDSLPDMSWLAETLAECGCSANASWIIGGDDTEEGGYVAAQQIAVDQLDGLIVMDDVMAMGVDRRLRELGIDVPGDLMACTFWNRGSHLRLSLPFERFEFDVEEQARQSMKLLWKAMNGRRIPEPHLKLMPRHCASRQQ
jgi:DNA-binding LacI/PurR family transcriptional regulator